MTNQTTTPEERAEQAKAASEAVSGWTLTHCYLCGDEFSAREIELSEKLNNDTLTDAEQDELETMDCPNGCWAKEEAAYRASKEAQE